MKRNIAGALSLLMTAGMAHAADPLSGIDPHNIDPTVRIQDDVFRHVNGGWLKRTEIPGDKARWGAFDELREGVLPRLRAIVEAAQKSDNAPGSEAQKIADMYASFMDEQRIEALGLKPLDADFARIAALTDKNQIPALIADLIRTGVTAPVGWSVNQDAREATTHAFYIVQSGLGLPDRDYYLKDDDAKLKEARTKYQAHIEKMLGMAGDKHAADSAKAIVALETELARVQWTKVENRDPVKRYNKVELTKLDAMTPGFDWQPALNAAGVTGKIDYVIVSQPSYLTGFAKLLKETPLSTWQAYFKWHVLNDRAAYLPKAYADADFAFNSTVLRGVPEQEVRWKRGVRLAEQSLGEALGKLYVEKHFPPAYKARMEALVANLLAAYRGSVDTLDWMSPVTKKQALAKLATFNPKIGYPNKWRDYSTLAIAKNDLVGNVARAYAFEYKRRMDKLGKPVDREEWGMTPQTVNAYYNPLKNEIVFPAAILQPPFFNPDADDAVNYGAIGAVIGHEISHGFDDQGSQFDEKGNLRDWWTREDRDKFKARTSVLVKQYGAFSPLPGYNVNGELTLGENIADNSGLAIAYKAYKLSLGGKEAPVIDGFSGDQRFYMGFAQVWSTKIRDNAVVMQIKTDPHSPGEFRANGTLRNQPGFYSTFGVKEGDKMYLPPDQRVTIW